MKHLTCLTLLLLMLTAGPAFARPAHAEDTNPAPTNTTAATAAAGLAALIHPAEEGMDAARANDSAAMEHEYGEIDTTWHAIENHVREADPAIYAEVEAALHDLETAVNATPVQPALAVEAFDHVFDEATLGVTRLNGGSAAVAAPAATGATLADFQGQLAAALSALTARNEADAANALIAAMGIWPGVEGVVAAKSPAAYETIESQLGKAGAALRAEPVDWNAVQASVNAMQSELAPLADQQTYTLFDAAAIILREGLEALLVVAALLAVLRRSNNQDKQKWIWGGAALGILLSIGVAFLLQAAFTQIAAGQNREVIEGVTSLISAALLLYVSYWLHSKASLAGWQRYINTSTARALARGNLIGLGLLALLAVFREGAETTVFYLGMAPSISANDLLLGVGIGMLLLVVAAWLMLVAGVRLPLRLFFRVAGILVFYLGFKFVGAGIHSLQVAGVVPVTPIPFLPPIPVLGIYPTWETLIPQLLMLAFAVVMTLRLRAQDRQVKTSAAAEPSTALSAAQTAS